MSGPSVVREVDGVFAPFCPVCKRFGAFSMFEERAADNARIHNIDMHPSQPEAALFDIEEVLA